MAQSRAQFIRQLPAEITASVPQAKGRRVDQRVRFAEIARRCEEAGFLAPSRQAIRSALKISA